eukprot:6224872-Amphidinium_carterae.1
MADVDMSPAEAAAMDVVDLPIHRAPVLWDLIDLPGHASSIRHRMNNFNITNEQKQFATLKL